MTTATTTQRIIRTYIERAPLPMFLSRFFQAPARNFYDTKTIRIDLKRDSEDVACVVTNIAAQGQSNQANQFTVKEFEPPIYKEEAPLTSMELLEQIPFGRSPFEDPRTMERALEESFDIYDRLARKHMRAIELQAAQVLQTGTLTLPNAQGVAAFNLSFSPKSTHFATVAIDWGTGTEDKLAQIGLWLDVIRSDGKSDPRMLVFGARAWTRFISDSAVLAKFENRRVDIGQVRPQLQDSGAILQGYIWIGNYQLELYTYAGEYKAPVTGTQTKYLTNDKIIALPDKPDFDATFGSIPRLFPMDPSVARWVPGRISSAERRLSIEPYAYRNPNGTALVIEAVSRPLLIPTAIDTFGCLNTDSSP